MKRLLLLALIVGCTDRELVEDPTQPTEAEQLFIDDVLPMLEANCVACHGSRSTAGFENGFLAGESWLEVRATLLASAVIGPEATRSRLLTKGEHSGPHLSAEQTSLILRWLGAEGL